jgi:hypothetical protein
VLAAGTEDSQNHQIGMGKEPAVGLIPGSLSRAGEETQVTAARQGMQVFQADSGQPGNLLLGEDLLARLDGHDSAPYYSGFAHV